MLSSVRALLMSCVLLMDLRSGAATNQAKEDLFESTNLLRIAIDIPSEGVRQLEMAQRQFNSQQKKTKVRATVREGRMLYTNVTVQLKGTGTFRSISQQPSLTLNFASLAPAQRFHGLGKISLNNSVQDPTCLNEKLSRELFTRAGVPVPRADHALVTLNGRDLGLYVLLEGVDKRFLKRHFKQTGGNVYDGGFLQDIDQPLQLNSGRKINDYSGLRRLVLAAREPDPNRRFAALEKALDVERFVSMIAMEAILCHWDSYSMNRSNYRVYHDPTTDKLVFIPHGMDRVLGGFKQNLDLALIPPMQGIAARALISTPEGRRRYLERIGTLFTNVFQPEVVCRWVREIDRKIAGALPDPGRRWPVQIRDPLWDVQTSGNHPRDVDALCRRITIRAEDLSHQFTLPAESWAPAPVVKFNSAGVAAITNWTPRAMYLRPPAIHQTTVRDGRQIWRITTPDFGAIGCRVSLTSGKYRLAGRIKSPAGKSVPNVILRYSGNRFGAMRMSEYVLRANSPAADWQEMAFDFQVAEGAAPEEIELLCEVLGQPRTGQTSGEIWFDLSACRLLKR